MKSNLLLRAAVLLCSVFFFSYQSLNAQTYVPASDTIGTGTSYNSSYSYPAPYGQYYYGARHQFLIQASEIPSSCSNIPDTLKSLSFDVASTNSGAALVNFTIKVGTTSLTSMGTTWQTGLTQVFTTSSYNPSTGINTHTFTTPFVYSGGDNLIVEVCFNNSSYTYNASTYYSTTSFTSVLYRNADASGVCSSSLYSNTSTNRPNMILGWSRAEKFNFDASIEAITAPVAACSFGSSESISVRIKNEGAANITSLPMAYTVNGGTAVTGTYTGTLTPGSTAIYTFSTTANLSSGSSFDIVAYNASSGDSCTANDTASTNVAPQMNGTYTIGGSSPDYSTVAAAVSDLGSIGVCGPVTFLLRDGTYSENVVIGAVSGTSSTNTVTFKSDPSNSALAAISGSSYAFYLNSASFLILDSLDLDGGSYGIYMYGYNDNVTIRNCEIGSSSSYSGIYHYGSTSTQFTHLTLENNTISGYEYAAYFYGYYSAYSQDLTLKNNTLTDFQYGGVYCYYIDTALIEGNTLIGGTYSGTQYGIYAYGSQHRYISNDITMTTSNYGYGIYSFGSGSYNSYNRCVNNMVKSTNNSSYGRGIYLSSSYWAIMYNSVYSVSNTTSSSYAALYAPSSADSIYNNAIYNGGTGYGWYGSSSAAHGNNVIYTEGSSSYISNVTLNSTEYGSDPGFNSTTDLHIGILTDCYNNGTPITGITTDIDGITRSTSAPDIGASEYDLPENDAGVVELDSPSSPLTAGTNAVAVTWKNFGIVNIDTLSLDWELNGTAQSSVSWTGSVAPAGVDTNVSLGSATFPSGFSTIKAWTYDPNNETDENFANDTMEFTVCTGLTGTYTLGAGSSFDFNSFDEAITALYTCGVSGPVTIDVDAGSGPYEEQVYLTGLIAGSNATNTITFAGGGATIEYEAAYPDLSIVRLDNVKHIIFDSLTIESTSTSYGWGISFSNQADSNTVQNCNIIVPSYASTYCMPIVFSGSSSSYSTSVYGGCGNYNNFDNNSIFGGYFSISMYGSSSTYANTGNSFTNNLIDGFTYYGFYARYAPEIQIIGNDITRDNSESGGTFYGIYLYFCTGGGININDNRIHDPFTPGSGSGYGITLQYSDGTSSSVNTMQNNAIYNFDGTTSTIYGIYNYSSDYWNMYHNSIIVEDENSTSGSTYGVQIPTSTYGINFKNNIIYITKDGSSEYCFYASSSVSMTSDYNDFWVDPLNYGAYVVYYSSYYSELTNWQASNSNAYDQNSLQEDPIFANTSIGNVSPLINTVDDAGTPLGVAYDINGDARSSSTPDMGAVEFVGVAGDMELVSAELVRVNACYNDEDSVILSVKNLIGGTIAFGTDTLIATWSITGPVNSTGVIEVNSGTLAAGATMELSTDEADLSVPGTYVLDAYIGWNAINESETNDTLLAAFEITVDTILTVTPPFKSITSPYDTVLLTANSPLIQPERAIFSEIIQWQYAYWAPSGGWPSWLTSDDNVELHGAPNASIAGYTVEAYYSNNSTPAQSYTFGSGSTFNSSGVVMLGWGGTAGNVNTTYNYHSAGLNSNLFGYSTQVGYILRDASGNILDVATHTSYSGFTFNSATGVTVDDWSGDVTGTPASGVRRIEAEDHNNASDWIQSYANGVYQNPGVYNSEVDPIPGGYSGTALEWSYSSSVFSNDKSVYVGPWTSTDTYVYIATLDSVCGTYMDTAIIDVFLTTASIDSSGNVSCNGGNDGWATASAEGGDSPYTYAWSNGGSTATATGLTAGLYTVTITDNNGWPDEAQITITEPTVLVSSASVNSNISCYGLADGGATASATGGTTSYSYTWSNSATTATISGVVAGTYSVTISDANGCTDSSAVTITQPAALVITIDSVDDVLCAGFTTGAMYTTTSGGTTNYSYSWTGGSTSSNLLNVASGTYGVTVTDAHSCTATAMDTVHELDPLIVNDSINNNLCNGDSTGSVYMLVSGGQSPYGYSWSNGGSGSSELNLPAGSYVVTVTDENSCLVVDSIEVMEPTVLVTTDSMVTPLCNGDTNGSIYINASGGTSPYSYSWSSGGSASSESNIGAGSYVVIITDDNGCSNVDSLELTEPDALMLVLDTLINSNCENGNDGSIDLSTTGGISPYSYAWSNLETTEDISGLAYGNYVIVVTDTNNCTYTDSFDVDFDNVTPMLEITGDDSICFGTTSSLMATSGYSTYAWSTGGNTETEVVDSAGSYSVVIIDSAGCMNSDSMVLWINAEMTLALAGTDANCANGTDGEATATGAGGTGNITYLWSNGETSATATNLGEDTIWCTITDGVGCEFSDYVIISHTFENPVVSLGNDTVICYIPEFGQFKSITLNAGSGFSSYAWSTSESTDTISASAPGVYSVVVGDANGCFGTDSITIDSMTCLGIDEQGISIGMNVYPNPTRSFANVELYVRELGDYTMTLMNLQGQIVQSEELNIGTSTFKTQIEKHNLSAGVYMLKVTNGKSNLTTRVIFE